MRIITIAALLSLPLVAAATTQTLAANYGSSANGGGSPGYNRGVATDYRLKKHQLHAQAKPKAAKKHAQAKPKAARPSGAAAPAAGAPAANAPAASAPAPTGQAGGAAKKQPMGRP